MNNILEMCQEAADIAATQRPNDLFETNVQHNAIFLSIAKNELDGLMRYGNWQMLSKKGEFLTQKGKTFYPFEEIVPDFYALIHNTMYIKGENEEVIGSLNEEEWMSEKHVKYAKNDFCFKIDNNGFRFSSMPEKNIKIVFLYQSNAVCVDAKTGEEKSTLTKNTDIPIFDKYVVKLGIIWRWLKRSGLDYEEEYNEYQKELKKRFGLELNVKDICLSKKMSEENSGETINIVYRG